MKGFGGVLEINAIRVLIINFQIVNLIICHSALYILFGHTFFSYTSQVESMSSDTTFPQHERSECVGLSACVKHGHVVQSPNCCWLLFEYADSSIQTNDA